MTKLEICVKLFSAYSSTGTYNCYIYICCALQQVILLRCVVNKKALPKSKGASLYYHQRLLRLGDYLQMNISVSERETSSAAEQCGEL